MATYTKETALYDTGAIAGDIQEAGQTASSYIANITDDGIFVHQTDSGKNGATPSAATAYGIHISDDIDIIQGGVSVALYGANARIGKTANGHVKVTSNGLEVWAGAETAASNKVASFGGTITLGTTESGKVTISNNTVRIGKMVLAFETDDLGFHYSRINPGSDESTLHIGYIGTDGEMHWKDFECQGISAKGVCEFLSNVVIGGNLSAGGNVTFSNVGTTTSAANARLGTNDPVGRLYRSSSSSKRYKHDIEDIGENRELDPSRLYDLDVRQFKYNDDYLDKDDIRAHKDIAGFIAEEVYEHYPIAAELDNDGRPQDWNVRYIVPPMLALLQEQHKEIEMLKQKIQELEEKR